MILPEVQTNDKLDLNLFVRVTSTKGAYNMLYLFPFLFCCYDLRIRYYYYLTTYVTRCNDTLDFKLDDRSAIVSFV